MVSAKKQIFFTGIVFIIIISILFFNIKKDYSDLYRTTTLEIKGIKQIAEIYKIDIILKSIRGLSQLNNKDAALLKKNLYIDDESVKNRIYNLKDERISKFYNQIIESKHKRNKLEIFMQYTNFLKLLKNKMIDIADQSYLFFESDREIFLLVLTTIIDLPQIIENIGRIRALGISLINKNDKTEIDKITFLLRNNIEMFTSKIEDIKYTLNKLEANDKSKLASLLDSILADFFKLNKIVAQIESGKFILDSKDYFLTASNLVNKIYNLFSVSKNLITSELKVRQARLRKKIMLGNFVYIFFVIMILIFMYKSYIKLIDDLKLEQKKELEDAFVKNIQNDYLNNLCLKNFCRSALTHLIDYTKALNGSMYLFDEKNGIFYLGASYGINNKELGQTLNIHENLISENAFESKIKVLSINQKIDLGNIVIEASKLVTMPIIELEKNIGTIQLLFDYKFNETDMKFLQNAVDLMATYISKTQKDEESLNYLQLIDKNVLISKTDLNGNITEVSEHLCRLSQYTKEELIGNNHRIFKHPDMKNEVYEDLWNTITQGKPWHGSLKNKRKDGSFYWVETYISPDKDINDNIIGYTAIRTDITDKKKIEEIAITDGLTSLYNKRHFDMVFKQQISISKRHGTLLAFAIIDIDHFKQYNDVYGHQEGDIALKKVAETLKKSMRRHTDFAFRLGGEEFGLLFHVKSNTDAEKIVNLVRQNIENLKIKHSKNSASKYVTISVGLYIIDNNDIYTEDEIYKKADDALYESKKQGRNRVTIVEVFKYRC